MNDLWKRSQTHGIRLPAESPLLTTRLLASFLETHCQVSGSSATKAEEGYLRQGHSDVPEKISSWVDGLFHGECQDC